MQTCRAQVCPRLTTPYSCIAAHLARVTGNVKTMLPFRVRENVVNVPADDWAAKT